LLLRGNRLVTVSTATASLGSLIRIDLTDNQLIDIPPGLARLRRLEQIDLSGNRHLISPPPEVVARGGESVLAYLRGLDLEADGLRTERAEAITVVLEGGAASAPAAGRLREIFRSARVDRASARRLIALGGIVGLLCGIVVVVATGIGDGSATTAKAASAVRSSASAPQSGASRAVLTDPSSTAQSPDASPAAPGASKAAPRTSAPVAPPVVAPVLPPSARPTYPVAPANVDLARGRPVTATSQTQNYVASNVVDGDTGTYWESTNGTNIYPQTLTVDLGSVTTVGRLVLDLPPYSNWNSRTQTLSVLGAGDGGRYSTIVGSSGYLFDARTGDTVTLTFSPVHVRYVQLYFTANSGWPAAQLSELAVYS
jgi:hypothetical protein